MVGLKSFGEAAWACEQVFNTQLAEQRAAEPPLIEFADWVLGYLGDWVEDIAAHRSGLRNERDVQVAAGKLAGAGLAGEPAPDISLPIGVPPRTCRAAATSICVRWTLHRHAAGRSTGSGVAIAPGGADDLSFELDLSKLDQMAEPSSEPGAVAPPAPTLADPAASAMFDRFDDAAASAGDASNAVRSSVRSTSTSAGRSTRRS